MLGHGNVPDCVPVADLQRRREAASAWDTSRSFNEEPLLRSRKAVPGERDYVERTWQVLPTARQHLRGGDTQTGPGRALARRVQSRLPHKEDSGFVCAEQADQYLHGSIRPIGPAGDVGCADGKLCTRRNQDRTGKEVLDIDIAGADRDGQAQPADSGKQNDH